MCDERTEFASDVAPVALLEIITLNRELRDLRSATAESSAIRRREYEAHVKSLNAMLDAKDEELAALRHKVVKLTPPLVPRHVAEEMGLRKGVETLIVDNIGEIEQLQRDLQAGTVSESLIRAGVAEASGLLAPKEPDKK